MSFLDEDVHERTLAALLTAWVTGLGAGVVSVEVGTGVGAIAAVAGGVLALWYCPPAWKVTADWLDQEGAQ